MSTILSTGRGCAWLHQGGVHGCTGGACMVALGGMHGCTRGGVRGFIRGHVWFYSGWRAWFYSGGTCVVLFWGACVVLFWGGACVVLFRGGGMCGFFSFFGYNEIRSMSGRYASYWNAFLFMIENTISHRLPLCMVCQNFLISWKKTEFTVSRWWPSG